MRSLLAILLSFILLSGASIASGDIIYMWEFDGADGAEGTMVIGGVNIGTAGTGTLESLIQTAGTPPGNVTLNQDMLDPSFWNTLYFPSLVDWQVNSTGQLIAGWADLEDRDAGWQGLELVQNGVSSFKEWHWRSPTLGC